MKRSIVLLSVAVFALLIIFQSCKKDHLPELDSRDFVDPGDNVRYQDMKAYDEFGPKLEKAVDRAIKNDEFKMALFKLTQARPTGDFEVLLSSLIDHKTKEGTKIKDILLEEATGIIKEKALDNFLEKYPSLIIATRGNVLSWMKKEHIPPVVFVKSDFKERDLTINGTKEGTPVEVRLDQKFTDAVIAMHISERHDEFGNLIQHDHTKHMASPSQPNSGPGINMSDVAGAGLRSCDPEPQSCTTPELTLFEVESINGGIRLTYEVDNFPASLCRWGKVIITRTGPAQSNGEPEIVVFNRYADESRIFYDVNVDPGTEYDYEIVAQMNIIHEDGIFTGHNYWLTCPGNTMTGSAVAPQPLPLLTSFVGENHNNSNIKYNWYPPSGPAVNEYRLRVLQNNNYEEVATVNASSGNNFYFYNHEPADRGNMIEMQIQYRESGPWSGDFFDRSYASYRNPNEPLKYYGIKVANTLQYEVSSVGESLIYGAPEVRLVAVRGAGNVNDKQTIPVQQTVIFMVPCVEVIIYSLPWPWGDIVILVPTDYFIPDSGQPVDIVEQWDQNLMESAITVKLTETDIADEVITEETQIEKWRRGISAEFGFKAPVAAPGSGGGGGPFGSIGVESTWESAQEKEFLYPVDDIDIDYYTIYYHYPYILPHCGASCSLFGYITDGESGGEVSLDCSILEHHLGE